MVSQLMYVLDCYGSRKMSLQQSFRWHLKGCRWSLHLLVKLHCLHHGIYLFILNVDDNSSRFFIWSRILQTPQKTDGSCMVMQSRLEEQLKCKLLALLAQKGSMTQEVSKRFVDPNLLAIQCLWVIKRKKVVSRLTKLRVFVFSTFLFSTYFYFSTLALQPSICRIVTLFWYFLE